jgi:hypothetical protein
MESAEWRRPMSCPYLKEVLMLYCEACPYHKGVPFDRLASVSPCIALEYKQCPIYLEARQRALPERRVGS